MRTKRKRSRAGWRSGVFGVGIAVIVFGSAVSEPSLEEVEDVLHADARGVVEIGRAAAREPRLQEVEDVLHGDRAVVVEVRATGAPGVGQPARAEGVAVG